jgi:hypothetical protein
MVDISADKIITLNDAAALLGRRISYSTWWRGGNRGVRGHKLQLTRIGGRTAVSVEALQTFIAAINSDGAAPATRTNRQRQAAIKRAQAECEAAGI